MDLINKILKLNLEQREKLLKKIEVEGDQYGIYPLTSGQYLLWCGYRAEINKTHFSNPGVIMNIKNITREKLDEIIEQLCRMHDALRFKYIEIDGKVFQYIDNDSKPTIIEKDLSDVPKEYLDEKVNDCCAEFYGKPFDLYNENPVMMEIIKKSESEFAWIICLHHIIGDAFSIGVLTKDIRKILEHTAEKQKYQFGFYALEQNTEKAKQIEEKNICYWTEKIKNVDKFMDIPTDYARNCDRQDNAEDVIVELSGKAYKSMKQMAKQTKGNMYNVISSLFSIVMQEYTRKKNIIFGTTFFNREKEKYSSLVGNFATVVPFVFSYQSEMTVEEYIAHNMQELKIAIEHGEVPITKIQEKFPMDRKEDIFPLYQITCVYNSLNMLGGNHFEVNGIQFDMRDLNDEKRQVHYTLDICFEVIDYGDKCQFRVHYCNKIFERESIENVIHIFQELMENIENLKNVKLRDIVLTGGKKVDLRDIRVVNEYNVCLPTNFIGNIQKLENELWVETGKVGKIAFDGTVKIDESKSYKVEYQGKEIDFREITKILKQEMPEIEVEYRYIDNQHLIMNYYNCQQQLKLEKVKKITGILPTIIYKTQDYKQNTVLRHQDNIYRSMDYLREQGYQVYALQNDETEIFTIVLCGETAAKNDEIEKLKNTICDDDIIFVYHRGRIEQDELSVLENRTQEYCYPQRKKSLTEQKLINIWKSILGHDMFGIYDHFYEVGGNSVKVLQLQKAINQSFEVKLKITDLFVYNTVSEQGRYLDQGETPEAEVECMHF